MKSVLPFLALVILCLVVMIGVAVGGYSLLTNPPVPEARAPLPTPLLTDFSPQLQLDVNNNADVDANMRFLDGPDGSMLFLRLVPCENGDANATCLWAVVTYDDIAVEEFGTSQSGKPVAVGQNFNLGGWHLEVLEVLPPNRIRLHITLIEY